MYFHLERPWAKLSFRASFYQSLLKRFVLPFTVLILLSVHFPYRGISFFLSSQRLLSKQKLIQQIHRLQPMGKRDTIHSRENKSRGKQLICPRLAYIFLCAVLVGLPGNVPLWIGLPALNREFQSLPFSADCRSRWGSLRKSVKRLYRTPILSVRHPF